MHYKQLRLIILSLIPKKCSWDIQTSCSSLEWRFANFSVEDATDSYDNELYYEEYYGEDHKEIEIFYDLIFLSLLDPNNEKIST